MNKIYHWTHGLHGHPLRGVNLQIWGQIGSYFSPPFTLPSGSIRRNVLGVVATWNIDVFSLGNCKSLRVHDSLDLMLFPFPANPHPQKCRASTVDPNILRWQSASWFACILFFALNYNFLHSFSCLASSGSIWAKASRWSYLDIKR
jgi:hypothetical protein